MSSMTTGDTASVADAPRSISPWQRAILVFTSPARAWDGLKQHSQWWFPLVVVAALAIASSFVLYDRVIIPTQLEAMDQKVAAGQMEQANVDKAEEAMRLPLWRGVGIGFQVVAILLITLFSGFLIWLSVGFILGTGMPYRLGLEVAAWSLLITIPASILTNILAWNRESMRGVHVGFGLLLPDMDPPSKMHVALGSLLDWIGPLSIWYLVVVILGAAALSGASRGATARTITIVYLVMGLCAAALAAVFAPGA